MQENQVKLCIKVRTTEAVNDPDATIAMSIAEKHLRSRQAGVTGTIKGYVSGHGGDVLWVQHDNGVMSAYCYDEFEQVE
jgi:hypothetical protein